MSTYAGSGGGSASAVPATGAPAGEARVLGTALLGGGLVGLAAAALPFSATAPRLLPAAIGAGGLLVGAALRWRAGRVPRAALHLVLALATVAVSVAVAVSTTPAGAVLASYGFVWIALYSAWYHPRGVAVAHVAGTAGGLAAGLAAAGAPAPVHTWVFVMATVAGVAAALHVLVARLRLTAERDQLTGLLNRAAFADAARRSMAQASRSGQPLTLALIDLDHFKQVNDREGHAGGDRLLVSLTHAWSGVLRGGDLLGRHGGDEFVLLLPGTAAGARTLLDRLREATTEGSWTIGVAEWRGEDLDRWLGRADEDLYRNKSRRSATGGG